MRSQFVQDLFRRLTDEIVIPANRRWVPESEHVVVRAQELRRSLTDESIDAHEAEADAFIEEFKRIRGPEPDLRPAVPPRSVRV